MEEVPRCTSLVPLKFPCLVHCLIGVETEGFLDYQGRAGIMSIVRWNLPPVVFGVEQGACFCCLRRGPSLFGKIPRPMKIKLALPPPLSPTKKTQPPSLKRGISWAWEVFRQKEPTKMPGAQKLAQPFPAPNCGQKNYGHQAVSECWTRG